MDVAADKEFVILSPEEFERLQKYAECEYCLCVWVLFVCLSIVCVSEYCLCVWVLFVCLSSVCVSEYCLCVWVLFVCLSIVCMSEYCLCVWDKIETMDRIRAGSSK